MGGTLQGNCVRRLADRAADQRLAVRNSRFWVSSAALLMIAAAVSFAPYQSAQAGALSRDPLIRVLLTEAREVTLRGASSAPTHLEARGGRLWVNQRPVGGSWRLPGSGVVSSGGMKVRGALIVHRVADRLQVVNELGLEDYVAGTVGREIYPGWHLETLKAQAVVARTYALYQRQRARAQSSRFDLGSGTGSQVYGGIAAETASIRAAVAGTGGEYLTHGRLSDQKPAMRQNEPILAVYHSASGGRTATAEEVWGNPVPYLVSVEVKDEQDSPDTYWRASISRTKLGRALNRAGIRVGDLQDVRVVKRSASGRALRVELRGEVDGHTISHVMEARALRAALGESVIRSTMFEIRSEANQIETDEWIFVGSGHGHGVGMSQWGAEAMAQRGVGYREILSAFYPGASIVRGGHP